MNFFRILWGIDAFVALIAVYFFFVGLADGSVSSFNISLWLGLLAALAGVLLGSVWLKKRGHTALAFLLLAILAFPALLYALMILLFMTSGGRWN